MEDKDKVPAVGGLTDQADLAMTLAHEWAKAAYNKALGKPFDDIDAIRRKLRETLATRAPADLEGLPRFTGEAISDIEVFEKEEFILAGDVRAALATTKQAGEPVAWGLLSIQEPELTDSPELAAYWARKGRAVTPLYAAPPASPVPVNDVQGERGAVSMLSGALNHACDALRFYAQQEHFHMHQPDAWDTVSGEPQNFYEDEHNTATVEDGSVAKLALENIAHVERYASAATPSPVSVSERVGDLALLQAVQIVMDGPLIESHGEHPYLNDTCKAMALTLANRIRALIGNGEQQSSDSGWIRVRDRLPKERGRYMVYQASFPEPIRIVNFGTSRGWENGRDKSYPPEKRITHWKPLPPPASNGNSEGGAA